MQEAMRSDTGPVPTIGSDGNPLLKSLEPSAVSPAIDGIDLRTAIVSKLTYHVGKSVRDATDADWYAATCLALRDREVDAFHAAARRSTASKRVCYLSMEFLIGQRLPETLGNLGLAGAARSALSELGVDLDRLFKIEPDPALGNGGLGRLAACFMESMATPDIPAVGYGIRYDYGLFRQAIVDGWQRERPDNWLSSGYPMGVRAAPPRLFGEVRGRRGTRPGRQRHQTYLAAGGCHLGGRARHPGRRLARPQGQPASPLARPCSRAARTRRVQ